MWCCLKLHLLAQRTEAQQGPEDLESTPGPASRFAGSSRAGLVPSLSPTSPSENEQVGLNVP